jgi:hypothetical protein
MKSRTTFIESDISPGLGAEPCVSNAGRRRETSTRVARYGCRDRIRIVPVTADSADAGAYSWPIQMRMCCSWSHFYFRCMGEGRCDEKMESQMRGIEVRVSMSGAGCALVRRVVAMITLGLSARSLSLRDEAIPTESS